MDRSAAYAARYVAKNIVAAGLARQCQIQVAYAIGVARPMNVTVYTEGTGVNSDEKTAADGHFGREEPDFSWERTDKAAALRDAAGLKG